MDKSIIIDKSTVEQAVQLAVKQVNRWTKKELAQILIRQNKKTSPLIIPIGSGFIIGKFALKPIGHSWQVLNRYNDIELTFINRTNAMFYAVLTQIGKTIEADSIQDYDSTINRLTIEAERFKYRLEQAAKKKNYVSYDIYSSRYYETMAQLSNSQFLLEKTLKSAKYYNF